MKEIDEHPVPVGKHPSTRLFRFSELSDTGVLWMINRTLFHPRGYALGLTEDGWVLLGDGSEVWSFSPEDDDECFGRFKKFIDEVPRA